MIKKLLITLSIMSLSALNANSEVYKDIPSDFWAYNQIDKMTQANVIRGYPDNTFKPNKFVTRAEYASIVIKAIGQENILIEKLYSFEDVPRSNWAWNAIERAVNLEIIKPVSASYFYPNDYVTRSEVITFLVNILKSEDITKKEAIIALQNNYIDFDDIPDWFKVTAGKAEVLNVIAKEPPREQYLDFDKYVTRAQMAVFLYGLKRYTDDYVQEKIEEANSPKIGEGIIIENVLYDGDVATLPEQTVLPVIVIGQISSNKSIPGQMFKAKFANNIVDLEHRILLSKDIILIGKVLNTKKAIALLRNGKLLFELSAANKNNNLTRILGVAEYEASITESNTILRTAKLVAKGKNFKARDGQILYVKLYRPMRVNVITGEVLD